MWLLVLGGAYPIVRYSILLTFHYRMVIGNLLIVVFLSLKNSPVFILIASSYERLNVLHRIAGYTTLLFAMVHASTYTAVFGAQNFLERLLEKEEIFGMVALSSFIALSFAGAVLRAWWY